ncbi:MAG: MBL fold metallo-hydrolase [Phycisphaerales bacterium]
MGRRGKSTSGNGGGGLRRAALTVRSALRRYPRAIVESLLRGAGDGAMGEGAVVDLLHSMTPHQLAMAWLGHASVVCQLEERVVAVDPVLAHRIGPRIARRTIGLARHSAAPVDGSALRGVDAVLITHAHFDHLDKPTLRAMASDGTPAIVPPGCGKLVPRGFGEVIELGAGMSVRVNDLEVMAVEPRHWGARVAFDRHRGANAYVVRSAGSSVLFTGDTAATDAFSGVGGVSGLDVAVFGIGAYNPWEHMHATPEQAWEMFMGTGARYLLPVHHGTFELSDEPSGEPMERLLRAAGDARDRVIESAPGEVVSLRPGAAGA